MVVIRMTGAFIAWILALRFVRANEREIFLDAFMAAVLSSLTVYVPLYLPLPFDLEYLIPVLFLLEALLVNGNAQSGPTDPFLIFLISLASYALVVNYLSRGFALELDMQLAGVFLTIAHGLMVLLMSRAYPEPGWRNWFKSGLKEGKKLSAPRFMIGLAAIVLCLCQVSAYYLLPPMDHMVLLWIFVILLLLFWALIALMCYAAAYRARRTEALVSKAGDEELLILNEAMRKNEQRAADHAEDLYGLLEAGRIKMIKMHAVQMKNEVEEEKELFPLYDPSMKALILKYRREFARIGLELQIKINDPDPLEPEVSVAALKILDQFLRNALEECDNQEDLSRNPCLEIFHEQDQMVIRMTNLLSHTIEEEDWKRLPKAGYTTREGHAGEGLSIVSVLVKQAGGSWSITKKDDCLVAEARLPQKQGPDHQQEEEKHG